MRVTTPTTTVRHGDITPASTSGGTDLTGGFDQYGESGDLLIDIDLVGHEVARAASRLAQTLELGGRISLRRSSTDDMTADDIPRMARYVGHKVSGRTKKPVSDANRPSPVSAPDS